MIYFCEKDATGRIVGWGTVANNNMIPPNCVECSKEDVIHSKETEILPDETPIPTQLDRLEAQTMYTAMMTDTLLED